MESEQKVSPSSDSKDVIPAASNTDRPMSAGRERTPPLGESK